jgi:hypothetical protein
MISLALNPNPANAYAKSCPEARIVWLQTVNFRQIAMMEGD